MAFLLVVSLLLLLTLSITNQDLVGVSADDMNLRTQPANHTQHNWELPRRIGRTDVPIKNPNLGLSEDDKSVFPVDSSAEGSTLTEDQRKGQSIPGTSTDLQHTELRPTTPSESTHVRGEATQSPLPPAKTDTEAPPALRRDAPGKAPMESSSTNRSLEHALSQSTVATPGVEPLSKGPIRNRKDDWSNVVEKSEVALTTGGPERAQYRPEIATATLSVRTNVSYTPTKPSVHLLLQSHSPTTASTNPGPLTRAADSQSIADGWSSNSTANGVAQDVDGASSNSTTPALHPAGQTQATITSPSPRGTTPPTISTTNQQQKELGVATKGYTTAQPIKTAPPITTETPTTTKPQANVTEPNGSIPRFNNQRQETTPQGPASSSTADQQERIGMTTSATSTPPLSFGRGRLGLPENKEKPLEKDQSVSLGHAPSLKPDSAPSTQALPPDPCASGSGPCVVPDVGAERGITNGSSLIWSDLSRTLSFAWELHVYGTAALFLLLTAGSALGLFLAPGMRCPHRGALALANILLLVCGALRAVHFLLDPYGTRLFLPSPAVTALYTLPLPLLLWAQAAVVLLVLRGADVALLPAPLQRPPLLAVLAVLQCTLLLAADLLAPALSPAVPVVLQSLTLTAGLALCLGYLCLVLPRLTQPRAAAPPPPACQREGKGVTGPKLRVLARVLAVCALLGALCCLLHAYACLWLYGLLGDRRRFSWAWWLVQFWARLLELGWAFCLLLLASWVFWRPQAGHGTGGQGPQGQAGASVTGDLPSPCQSSTSSHRHTCWAKIVQSLKGRPHRKSDSNGVSRASGPREAGELPNNWAGQERSGADISKSLIRNRDPPKESNRGRNQRGNAEGSTGSLLRLQALGQPPQRSMSGSLDQDKDSALSFNDFDLRPPSPIDLSRSIDNALHREHLLPLRGGSLFQPLGPPSLPPSPGPWLRRNSDPQLTLTSASSSDDHTLLTESSCGLERSIPSAVPSRQVTAPPTPSHRGPRWCGAHALVPTSLSCPVTLQSSQNCRGPALTPSVDVTLPFLTPDPDGAAGAQTGEGSGTGPKYLKVARHEDSTSISSDIIDL